MDIVREEVNAAMAAGGGGAAEVEDALAEMQEQLLAAAQERQRVQQQGESVGRIDLNTSRSLSPVLLSIYLSAGPSSLS